MAKFYHFVANLHNFLFAGLTQKFDMVMDFVIDPMHCIHINASKRVFNFTTGKLKGEKLYAKLTATNFSRVGQRFASIKFPVEFHRQPRNFDHLVHYKASEHRMLLLYGYEVMVNGLYPPEIETLVQYLAVGTRILSDENFAKDPDMVAVAKQLFEQFLTEAKNEFGSHFITLNMHLLMHLPDDALLRGSIDKLSCFKFENALKTIKKHCSGTKKPLKTLANNLAGQCVLVSNVSRLQMCGKFAKVTTRNTKKDGTFTTCVYGNLTFSTRSPDCFISTKKDHVYRITSIEKERGEYVLKCRRIKLHMPAWTITLKKGKLLQLSSCKIGVYKARIYIEEDGEVIFGLDDVLCKYVRLVLSTNLYYFYPLLAL